MDTWIIAYVERFIPSLQASLPWVGEVNLSPFITAVVLFVGLNLFFKLLQSVVVARLKHFSTKTVSTIDDVLIDAVAGIRNWVVTIISIFIALQLFELSETVDTVVTAVTLFAVAWQAIEIAARFVDYAVMHLLAKDEDGDGVIDPGAATASDMVTLMSRIVLWVLGGLFVLSNLGIEVTSLIAGLGIGGVAVAFALQGILSDLFASFSIYFDRPFRIGDFIVIGSDSGTVEKIGIKSTRLKTLQGEELVVSNAELTAARVQNFKKMAERRIVTQIGITYDTPQEQVQGIPGIIKQVFESLEGGRLDRAHFISFGDSALIFEIVYYVGSADYTVYLDIQHKFNNDLMTRFAEAGIEFAYPTQTIYHKAVT